MKLFPIMLGRGQRAWVPWSLVEPLAQRLDTNHGQTVERLAQRGGLEPSELAAAIQDKLFNAIHNDVAWNIIWEAAEARAEGGGA